MWFSLGVQNFLGKKNHNVDSCDIFVSDFVRIWHKSLSNDELFSISKALNPLLEVSVQKLKDLTLNLLEDVRVLKEIKEDSTNNNISLKLQSNIMGVKFQFQVLLKQGNSEMLYKELTAPLLLLLIKVHEKEKKLRRIIEEKDAEIESYKQEYGTKPNYLTTKPFNEMEFSCEYSSWSSFLDSITSKVQSTETAAKIKENDISEAASEKNNTFIDKSNKNKTAFKDKNSASKSCVLLDNQTIRKRKKHNEFKISF